MSREITTANNRKLTTGDAAFNYYDHKPGVIGEIDDRPQPDTASGQNSSTPIEEWSNYWFNFIQDDGTQTTLDGSRICTLEFARWKGWVK